MNRINSPALQHDVTPFTLTHLLHKHWNSSHSNLPNLLKETQRGTKAHNQKSITDQAGTYSSNRRGTQVKLSWSQSGGIIVTLNNVKRKPDGWTWPQRAESSIYRLITSEETLVWINLDCLSELASSAQTDSVQPWMAGSALFTIVHKEPFLLCAPLRVKPIHSINHPSLRFLSASQQPWTHCWR